MTVTIEGLTPLIVNRFSESKVREMEEKQQKAAKVARKPRQPEQEFLAALYEITPGHYGFPAAGIKKALVSAGGRFADETMTVLRGVISIVGDLLEIRGPEPVMRKDMVVLKGGTTSIAYRPQFTRWEMDVPMLFNENMISREQVLNLFNIAGFAVGLGSWRPECKGNFGQFRIKGAQA
jgi:hypothetical protein